MTQLHILGTDHRLQCGTSAFTEAAIAAYELELQELCAKHSLRRIAEEICADGLAHHGVRATVANCVASQLTLEYQLVDLNHTERASLSINDYPVITTVMLCSPSDGGASFRDAMSILADEVRERIWVSRLLTLQSWPCLFICGADHVQAVRRLWSAVGLKASIVHRDYAP